MYLSGNEVRKKENFNRDWYFFHEKDAVSGKQSGAGNQPVPGEAGTDGFRPVKLPHDWSLDYPFSEDAASCGSGGYAETGIGWYRKAFCVDPEAVRKGRVILRFDGAYMLARVWLNGKELGRHVYGYTPFEWDVTELLKADGEENIVDVEVDNSAQPNSRWYSGSGITRDVWLIGVRHVHIAPYGVYARCVNVTEESASLIVETRVAGAAGADIGEIGVETRVYAPDGNLCQASRTVTAGNAAEAGMLSKEPVSYALDGEMTFARWFDIPHPQLWSSEHPVLYRVEVILWADGEKQDEISVPAGIRSVAFDCSQGFLINGKREKLNGVCVHHDGGSMGAAVPVQIWERRLKKLKNMGVNAIRMSHNPPDPGLLDLCDRMGFYVMDEAFDEWRILKGKELGSNTHESRGYSEWFEECHEEDLTVMLLRDRNHPSIVIWSIGNEVPDQTVPEGCLTARSLKALCKKLVPGCFVTQANDQICAEPRAAREDFLDELDVVGYNYVGRWRTRAETLYDDDKRARPDRCVIGTENSGLGGVRGEYSLNMSENAGWWKRPYYSAPVVVGKLLHFTMVHDYVAGDFMWTGIDYLGEAHWPSRSSSAGVLDTCGFEKDSFYFYQSIWKREEPMVHLLPHWNLDVPEGTILPVLGYTSCDSAELFLNGKSYGKKAYAYPAYGMTERYGHFDREPEPVNTDDLFLSWDVPYEPGCIELVGYKDGIEAARHTVRTAGAPAVVRTACYRQEAQADGLDVAQIEVWLEDAEGNFCPQADGLLTFQVEGAAELIGVDNGNPEGMESLRGDRIHAFHGRALAVIRSNGAAGEAVVTVKADGLQESSEKVMFI